MKRAVLALALLLAACGHKPKRPFELATPAGFVELPRQSDFDYRASTVDGVVLGVSALRHDPKADVGFWADATLRRLRLRNGYALLEQRAVQVGGREARQLRFGHDEAGTPHIYWITLVTTDDHLFLLEAGGASAVFQSRAPVVEGWLAAFQITERRR